MKTTILRIGLTILALGYGRAVLAAVPDPIMKFSFENSLQDSIAQTHQAGIDGDVTFQNSAPDAAGGPVSVRFSGTPPSRIIVTNSADLNMNAGATFSMAAWIKTDFNSGDRVVLAKSAALGDLCGAHTSALMVDGSGNLRYDNFCVNEVHSVAFLRDSQWHHVGMSYDGTTYRLYVDGVLDGAKSFPGSAEGSGGEPPWRFTVGESLNPTFPTGVFSGNVDDVTFWNVTLTDEQFLEHYLQRAPTVGVRITEQPVNRTVLTGAAATFSVSATIRGADPSTFQYQWQKNMTDLPGATNAVYTTPATTLADNDSRYRVVVSAPGATPVISSEVTLNVLPRESVPGPLAWLDFENRLDDQSFLGTHDGTAIGGFGFAMSSPTNVAGNSSGSLNGTDSRIELANSGDLNINAGNPFTISAWIRTDFSDGLRVIAAKSAASGDLCGARTAALMVDDTGNLRYDNFCVNELHSSVVVRNGLWQHVALTYDGSIYRLYVNGTLDASKSFPGSAEGSRGEPPWTFSIGQTLNPAFPTGVFKGNIDEVAFWNVALSPSQIVAVSSEGVPRAGVGIISQPADQTALVGQTATFTVVASASGAPPEAIRYQWQKNMGNIPDATNASYTTPVLALADDASRYRVIVSLPGISTNESREAILTVLPVEPVPGALAWIDFENRLEDRSFLGTHDGTAVGGFSFDATSPNATAGSSSGLFNGSDSRVELANSTDLRMNSGDSFTIAAWIKTDFSDGLRIIAAKSAASGDLCGGRTGAFFVDDLGSLRWDSFCLNEVHSATPVRNGQWNHVAVTYDARTYRLYVNGRLDGTKAFGGAAEGTEPWTFTIGQTLNPTFPTGVFSGNVDEVAFWGQPLSRAQIIAVMSQGIPRTTLGFTAQPKDRSVLAGEAATFSVTAVGMGIPAESLRYQWQKNRIEIPAATNATYTTPATRPADSGSKYRAVVSAAGAMPITSTEATLTVFSLVRVLPTPIGWLNFENQLDDQSIAGTHNGTPMGGFTFDISTPNIAAGDFSGLFNGMDSRVSLANSGDLNVNQGHPYTVAAWIKTDFNDGFRIIVAKSAASGDLCGARTAALGVDNGGNLRYDNFCVNEVHSAAVIRDGQWHPIGMTYDGSTYRLYVDGVLDGTKSFLGSAEGSRSEPPWTFTIGQTLNPTFPTGVFKGNIDEVAFWSQALSDAQMFSLPRHSVPFGLSITRTGAQVMISWGGNGFVLQQNRDLANPQGWADLSEGNVSPVVVNVATRTAFYRLRRDSP